MEARSRQRILGSRRWIPSAVLAACASISAPSADLMPGNCPPQDLLVTLNTGWDENAEAAIAAGLPDDDWNVLVDASGFPPGDAVVVNPSAAWLTLPESGWIATGAPSWPNGTYIYEYCWCMDDSFSNPLLEFAIRADDAAIVRLNGFNILTLPEGTFNDPTPIGISVIDPSKFLVGLNCMTVHVQQIHDGPTGFNLTGSVTADDGRCCGCYELPPDAEAWWPLNETSGTTAADIVNGHDGTLTQFSGFPPGPAHGIGFVSGALSLDGVDDYVDVPDHPGLDFGAFDDLTIDAWVRTTTSTRQPIVNKKEIPIHVPGYTFMTASGVLSFEMADGTSTVVCNAGSGLNDGAWHFVAVTLDHDDPAGLKLYINGLPVGAACNPAPVGSMANALHLQIGARPSLAVGAMWWRGELDEIEIFRRALTPTEIHELFLAQHAGKCPPEQPMPCDESGYPTCNGVCPPGEVCLTGPNQACGCEPTPPCGYPGDYPACGGPCPQGLVCNPLPGANACGCVEEFPDCGDTSYPACDGACPQGQQCVNEFGTDRCRCEPDPAPCGDALYPACGGACPANQKCVVREVPFPGCECASCTNLGTSGLDGITLGWTGSKSELRWKGAEECALVYNAYRGTGARLPDTNADGLADDYGSCFAGDVIGGGIVDPDRPQPGAIHWYLVTGENFGTEGSLGTNGNQVERPNQSPCP